MMTNIILEFKKIFPELSYLVFIFKYILKAVNLNDAHTGGMSSFNLQLLIISYLQQTKKKYSGENLYLSQHLLRFLDLYGNSFSFETLAISVRKGGFYYPRPDAPKKNEITAASYPLLFLENPIDSSINCGTSTR